MTIESLSYNVGPLPSPNLSSKISPKDSSFASVSVFVFFFAGRAPAFPIRAHERGSTIPFDL